MSLKVVISECTARDLPEVAAVHVSSWQSAYKGLMPDEILTNLCVEKRFKNWQAVLKQSAGTLVIAIERHKVIGFLHVLDSKTSNSTSKLTSEITVLYVSPDHYRKSVGQKLIDACISHCKNKGILKINLWVLSKNLNAIAFYRKNQFQPSGRTETHNPTGLAETEFVKAL